MGTAAVKWIKRDFFLLISPLLLSFRIKMYGTVKETFYISGRWVGLKRFLNKKCFYVFVAAVQQSHQANM
jgi:hypothetical protein